MAAFAHDPATLDACLLFHAMARTSDPYDTWFPASTWAQVAGFDAAAELDAAKSRWAKPVTKLEQARLVNRKRVGNKLNFMLLHSHIRTGHYKNIPGETSSCW